MRLLALILFIPAMACAQDPLGTLLGAGVRLRPEYDGASKQELQPIPVIRYYGRTLFARTTQGILEGGARLEVAQQLWIGAQLAFEEGNDRTDLDPGGSYGLHAEWDTRIGPAPVGFLARTRTHFDSERGTQADLRASVGVYGSGGLYVFLFAQGTWASSDWLRSYYATEGGGLMYSALGVEAAYDLSARWVLLGSLQGRQLHGHAATSPITEEQTNYFTSIGLAYRF
ncbi:MAG TPA: MipA/OmpV family protein [Burkholderiales bacterium]|jgi:outer membrane scaffolding protein for murein synthesis (MipA/OmpV family)